MLGSQTLKKETKVRVVLVAGTSWVQSDRSYRKDFVDQLRNHVLETWGRQAGLDIVCNVSVLPMENEEHLTGWLLGELFHYFRTSRGEAEAFIDLTSAPKEWQFAAINASSFFPKVELYYIKPTYVKVPRLYDDREKDDPGHPKLEVVRTGAAAQPLQQWIHPKNEKGEPSIHYRLFETIFRFAESIALEKGLDPSSELDKVLVPIQEDRGLEEYRHNLRRYLRLLPPKFAKTVGDDSHLRKSIKKCLTTVQLFKLFDVKGRSVQMTSRAVTLGQALFARKRKQRKKRNRPK